jgi:DNA-binding IscR family transcriptional regulator
MRPSRAAAYALRALAYLTRHEGEGPAPSSKIGAVEGLPGDFLSKVMKRLASAGVLGSSRGTGGGYRLARPPRRITLLDVIEAVDGPVRGGVPRWAADAGGPVSTPGCGRRVTRRRKWPAPGCSRSASRTWRVGLTDGRSGERTEAGPLAAPARGRAAGGGG